MNAKINEGIYKMDECINGWTNAEMDGRMQKWMDECRNGWTNAEMDG